MFEQKRGYNGECVCVIDEETGDLFYIGDAEIAFVAYDPIDDTWHTGAKFVGFDIIRQMMPNKEDLYWAAGGNGS
jgi:hypothetical protein